MFFPEDTWKIIKEFMLISVDGILFDEICSIEPHSVELQYHVFYRLLQTDRIIILRKMMRFMHATEDTLRGINHYTTEYVDVDYEDTDNFWEDYEDFLEKDRVIALKCIQTRRVMDRFMNIYETAPIKTLMEIFYYTIKELRVCSSQDYETPIGVHFRLIQNFRRKMQGSIIDCLWEITDCNDIAKIQDLCRNPVLHIEKEGRHFVLAFNNENSYLGPFNAFKKKGYSFINMARKIGVFANDHHNMTASSKFKQMMNFLDFPFTNYDKDFQLMGHPLLD